MKPSQSPRRFRFASSPNGWSRVSLVHGSRTSFKEYQLEGDDELAMLVGTLVQRAQALLKSQRGEFFSFAAFVNTAGRVEMAAADLGVAQPKSTEVIDFLRGALQAMASQGKIKGSGICVNVGARLPGYDDKLDAICCFIERAGHPPIDFYVPFRKALLGYKYDKPIALPGTPRIFPAVGGNG